MSHFLPVMLQTYVSRLKIRYQKFKLSGDLILAEAAFLCRPGLSSELSFDSKINGYQDTVNLNHYGNT